MSVRIPQNKLNGNWDIYYHLPQETSWSLASYKLIMGSIDTAEKIIALNNAISENIVKYCMIFVMKKGITPMWEDPKNRTGGCFSYKVFNKQVFDVWKTLLLRLCGETLCIDKKYNQNINGITISPKKNFCIIKIWLENCNLQDPNIISNIPDLSNQGCLFKKHEPEF